MVWFADLSFSNIEVIVSGAISFPDWLGFGLACLWITGMANAVNLIDGLDGLASGVTLFGLTAVAVVGFLADVPHFTWMATLFLGCILGVLVLIVAPRLSF